MGDRGKGYTLVELLVVLSLCSVLAVFSLSALNALSKNIKQDTAIRLTASALRFTQSCAIARNESCAYDRFIFAKTGFTPPGGNGTKIYPNGKKLVLSSYGRVRIE